ncbi:MAG: hypothetical protein IIX00_07365 [Tidjanibacter sp.]|nr:hypothetical protein [Tidjanibacter sp.]
MKVLVIGSGGRCHAIVEALSRSPKAEKIYCAPGNAGIASLAECVAIKDTDVERLVEFAKTNDIGLTVVGPEAQLAIPIAAQLPLDRKACTANRGTVANLVESIGLAPEECRIGLYADIEPEAVVGRLVLEHEESVLGRGFQGDGGYGHAVLIYVGGCSTGRVVVAVALRLRP